MTAGVSRSEGLRWENRRRILTLLRQSGCLSRTDIAGMTGMSHSTVSAITNALLADGVLIPLSLDETAAADGESRRGRPQISLALNPAFASVVAVDVALNLIALELINYAGEVIARRQHCISTLTINADELLAELDKYVGALLSAYPQEAALLEHISVGVQGMTDAAQTTLVWSPTIGARNVTIADWLEQRFHVPVVVSNDCLMIVESLRWAYPETFQDDFAVILFSSGIGMGLILKGKPFSGARTSAAEFGHIVHIPEGALCRCGRKGCVEAYASDYGIWRAALGVDENTPPLAMIDEADFATLRDQARAGDGLERRAFQRAGKALGFALRSMFSLIDPVPLAFVGPVVGAFDLIEDDLREIISGGTENDAPSGPHNGLNSPKDLSIQCFASEHPLILHGCAITSLTQVDAIRDRRVAAEPLQSSKIKGMSA